VPLTHIYASPLKRAHSTAQHVHKHQPAPKPSLNLNPNLREQHFGIAEGHPWVLQPPEGVSLEQLFADNIFPVLYGNEEKFPEGESFDDLSRRAAVGLQECVLPHLVVNEQGKEHSGVHVALASHGLCIGALLSALVKLDPKAKHDRNYTGLMNTAWTRAEISVRVSFSFPHRSVLLRLLSDCPPTRPSTPDPLILPILHLWRLSSRTSTIKIILRMW